MTLSTTKTQLEDAEQKLADAQEQFDQARDAAYKKADLSGVLTADMLGNILMAQNFNMPAGYITEGEEQYLVKVGEEYASLEELENTLLMHMDVDGVGDVRLSDVADIALTDNAGCLLYTSKLALQPFCWARGAKQKRASLTRRRASAC